MLPDKLVIPLLIIPYNIIHFFLSLSHTHTLALILSSNEREGIPVELIHLLDECVEIPQFGVIRSLNVHVSGAIVVWEYTKQHLQL